MKEGFIMKYKLLGSIICVAMFGVNVGATSLRDAVETTINVNPDVVADCWVAIRDGDKVIGLYNLHPHNSCTLEIHAQILKEYRKEYSAATGEAVLRWIVKNAPSSYQKLIAQIPVIYENVKLFTCSQGFQVEGVNRMSYRKNGVLCDQWLLGQTMDEVEGNLICLK